MRRRGVLAGVVMLVATALVAVTGSVALAHSLPVAAEEASMQATRIAGQTRYETSVGVSQRFDPGVPAAFVATGTDFPDALAATAASALSGGPLLLTPPDALPALVGEELRRLRPATIYVMGGRGAVTDTVLLQLAAIAPTKRIGGPDRYATSRMVVDELFGTADRVFIATGRGFPDALAAGAAAGTLGVPLLLVDGTTRSLDAETLDALERWGVQSIEIAGGHGAVDLHLEQQLRTTGYAVDRHAGATRYETAVAIRDAFFGSAPPPAVYLATGTAFPDALSAAALAGSSSSPLLLTYPGCVPRAAHAVVASVPVTARFVVGGSAAVSDAAAANSACAQVGDEPALEDWAMTGWRLADDVALPYSDRPPVDVYDERIRLDESGLVVFTAPSGGRADHPVAYAQYGISALAAFEATQDELWLDRALRHGERLEQMRTQRAGAWWFPYLFSWTYYTRTLHVPWWSGMAQGEALSLFVRLFNATDDPRWREAADRTWRSFLQPREPGQPWMAMVHEGHLFFEEYAGNQPPLLVLNGHAFAIFGVYDYWLLTRDATAAQYIDGAATTVLSIMPDIREPGQVSYYCVQESYCDSPLWQNPTYHVIHSWQLDTLARLTDDDTFADWAAALRADWQPEPGSLLRMLPLGGVIDPPQ